MEPQPSQADPVDTKFKRPELVSRPREPAPPARGVSGGAGGVSEALEGANGRSADPLQALLAAAAGLPHARVIAVFEPRRGRLAMQSSLQAAYSKAVKRAILRIAQRA
jgi:hypothetical protein